MMQPLHIIVLVFVLFSGCVSIASPDLKYVDPDNEANYIVFHTQESTFTVVTEDYIADGVYTQEGDYLILHYTGYVGAVSVKKTESGLDIGDGVVWKRTV